MSVDKESHAQAFYNVDVVSISVVLLNGDLEYGDYQAARSARYSFWGQLAAFGPATVSRSRQLQET